MPADHVLLFTDVVDSTRLTESLGDEAASRLWSEHDRIARRLLAAWRGREIDKSDGFLLLFDDVDRAVGYALELHAALGSLQPPLASRAGIHLGPMVTRANSEEDIAQGAKPLELDGVAKAVASRIMGLARGGQTLLSASGRAALSPGSPWRAQSHGHWRLKGLADPIELFEVGGADAAFAPPPDSAKAYRVVPRGDGWTPMAELRHSVPAERDDFIGRSDALKVLAGRFDEGARLVCLLGIGGVGKTRLALRYARDWLGSWPGGAWFCDLSSARSLDGIVHAVAQGLDVPLGKADPVRQLAAAIAGRGRCLVVLDNFEQVARHAEASLGAWLAAAPQAGFLVTSREVLSLVGEQVLGLPPLSAGEAVALFERRARAADDRHPLSADDIDALPQLVELLDRLPLAIELAAARIRVLPVRAMLGRVGERFKMLVSSGGRHDRQATLLATLDWSWELLTPAEQSALVQLTVFEGGFELAAAEAVLDLARQPGAPWAPDLLQNLVEKSLLAQQDDRRFGLLRTVHEYLLARAEGSAELRGLRAQALQRHWKTYAAMPEDDVTARRGVETENLVVACLRAAEHHADEAAAVLANGWNAMRLAGPFRAVLPLVDVVDKAGYSDPRQLATLHWVAAGALHQLGQVPAALERARLALQHAERTGDLGLRGRMHLTMCEVLRTLGQQGASEHHGREALACAEAAGDGPARMKALNSLGALHYVDGKVTQALPLYEAALELARALGQRRWLGGLLGNLGSIRYAQGQLQQALSQYREALAVALETGDRQWGGNHRSNLGLLLHELGEHVAAADELQRALQTARDLGHARLERIAHCNLAIVREALGETALALSSYEEAIALCVAQQDPRAEGEYLGRMGLLLARAGSFEKATAALARGEELLRGSDDRAALAMLLTQAALAASLGGDAGRARRCIDETSARIREDSLEPDAEWRRWLHEVQQREGLPSSGTAAAAADQPLTGRS